MLDSTGQFITQTQMLTETSAISIDSNCENKSTLLAHTLPLESFVNRTPETGKPNKVIDLINYEFKPGEFDGLTNKVFQVTLDDGKGFEGIITSSRLSAKNELTLWLRGEKKDIFIIRRFFDEITFRKDEVLFNKLLSPIHSFEAEVIRTAAELEKQIGGELLFEFIEIKSRERKSYYFVEAETEEGLYCKNLVSGRKRKIDKTKKLEAIDVADVLGMNKSNGVIQVVKDKIKELKTIENKLLSSYVGDVTAAEFNKEFNILQKRIAKLQSILKRFNLAES